MMLKYIYLSYSTPLGEKMRELRNKIVEFDTLARSLADKYGLRSICFDAETQVRGFEHATFPKKKRPFPTDWSADYTFEGQTYYVPNPANPALTADFKRLKAYAVSYADFDPLLGTEGTRTEYVEFALCREFCVFALSDEGDWSGVADSYPIDSIVYQELYRLDEAINNFNLTPANP